MLYDYSWILCQIYHNENIDDISDIISKYKEYKPIEPKEPIHPTINYKASYEEALLYLEKIKQYELDNENYQRNIVIYNENINNFEKAIQDFIKDCAKFEILSDNLKNLIWEIAVNDVSSKYDNFCKYYNTLYERLKIYVNLIIVAQSQNKQAQT